MNRSSSFLKCSCISFVLAIRFISNVLYFKKFGPLSSSGADIWFYIGVAKGYYHLFVLDPLQIILPLFGFLSIETLFYGLIVFSNLLHFITVWILFLALRRLYQNERAALWSAAVYSCLSSSFLFCTGTFLHQQTVLPILVALAWLGINYLHNKSRSYESQVASNGSTILILVLICVGATIGPDIWIWIATAIPCFLARRFRNVDSLTRRRFVGSIALVTVALLFFLLAKTLYPLFAFLANKSRGIDLAAQNDLHAGDLMPLTWSRFLGTYSFVGYIMIALLIFAWIRGRFFEVSLSLIPLLFSINAVRFFFILEVALAFLFCWVFTKIRRTSILNIVGLMMVISLLSVEGTRGFVSLCPSSLIKVLTEIKKDPSKQKLVLGNASYGFLIKVAAEAEPVTDVHHLDFNMRFMKLLALPAAEAISQLKREGVTHLLLTSHDFKETYEPGPTGSYRFGTYSSGGLEKYLSPLSEEDLKRTLVYQSFTPLFQTYPIQGIKLMAAGVDPATKLEIVLYRLE